MIGFDADVPCANGIFWFGVGPKEVVVVGMDDWGTDGIVLDGFDGMDDCGTDGMVVDGMDDGIGID